MKHRTILLIPALILGITACGNDETLPQIPQQLPTEQHGSETNDNNENKNEPMETKTILIKVGNQTLTMTLTDNSSARALVYKLKEGDLTVSMQDYANFEKVGPLGFSLPTNDTRITTGPGDVILYQGRNLVIYYDRNSWSFTRLGKIEGATRQSLLSVLGTGNVNVTLSLSDGETSGIDDTVADDGQLRVHISGRTIKIVGKETASAVNIFSLDGQTIYSGNSHQIELPGAGIYVVTCDNAKAKIQIN